MGDVSNLVNLLLTDDKSEQQVLKYFYELINVNFERTKMYANPFTTSSIGI
jgi:hypothetical protein